MWGKRNAYGSATGTTCVPVNLLQITADEKLKIHLTAVMGGGGMRVWTCLLICLLWNPAYAVVGPCPVEYATDLTQMEEVTRTGRSSEVMKPMLNELAEIIKKGKHGDKPLSEQLSATDAARFGTLNAQIAGIRLFAFVDSARSRDAEVVSEMWQTAWKNHNDASVLPSKDDVGGAVMVMRLIFPNPDLHAANVEATSCSADVALSLVQNETTARVNSYHGILEEALTAVNRLKAKYHLPDHQQFDPSKMTPEDLTVLRRVTETTGPLTRESSLSADIQNIRDWWAMSTLVYETRKQDISVYGADITNLGKTLNPMIERFDDRSKFMLGMWQRIDEQVKSRQVRILEMLQPALK